MNNITIYELDELNAKLEKYSIQMQVKDYFLSPTKHLYFNVSLIKNGIPHDTVLYVGTGQPKRNAYNMLLDLWRDCTQVEDFAKFNDFFQELHECYNDDVEEARRDYEECEKRAKWFYSLFPDPCDNVIQDIIRA